MLFEGMQFIEIGLQSCIEMDQGFYFLFTAFHKAPQIFIADLRTEPVTATMNTKAKIKSKKNKTFCTDFQ